MFGISFAELAIIFLLVLIVMGPEKLPDVARWAGKGMRELRKASNTVRNALEAEQFDATSSSSRQIGTDSAKTAAKSANPDASAVSDTPDTDPAPSTADAAPEPDTAVESTPAQSTSSTPGSGSAPPQQAPANLDQVDDDHFNRILERQYQFHDAELQTTQVELAPAVATDETTEVALPAVDEASGTLFDVALPILTSAEAA